MTDELVKLVPLEVLVPEQFDVSYPGNDAWMQLDPNASAPSGDPAWLQIEKYLVSGGGTPKTVTALLQAQVDTAQFKFGSSSALFDGVGDYLSSPDHSDFVVGSGDFTAECWVRFSDTTKTAMFMSQWDAGASQMSWGILWNGSTQLALTTSVNGSTNVGLGNWTWAPSNGVWYHVAFVRSGTSLLIYVDGMALGAAADALRVAVQLDRAADHRRALRRDHEHDRRVDRRGPLLGGDRPLHGGLHRSERALHHRRLHEAAPAHGGCRRIDNFR